MNEMPKKDKDALAALYRMNPILFYQRGVEELYPGRIYHSAPYVEAIFRQLARVASGDITRLAINIPPRHFKSTIVSVVMVAYYLGLDPTRKILVVSYSRELAVELHNATRDLMQSNFYKLVFPKTKIRTGKNTEEQFKTTLNGGRMAASLGSAVTGFGADLIICDDLMKPEDALSDKMREKANAYVQNTLLSRLEDKKHDAMILVQQRLHPLDTTGMVQEMGGWQHLKLPAIATTDESIPIGGGKFFNRKAGEALDPEREDLETLKKIRSEVGIMTFSAQWQQEPVLPGGNLLKLEQFKRYDELPPRHRIDYIAQSWDPAVTAADTSDYSVCTTWAVMGDKYYLMHVYRAKLDFADLEKAVERLLNKFNPQHVVFEGSHGGRALYSKYRGSSHCRVMRGGTTVFNYYNPRGTKIERAAVQSVKIEKGQVYLPKQGDWLEAFEREIVQFPNARYDDQVDSMSQFLLSVDCTIPYVNY